MFSSNSTRAAIPALSVAHGRHHVGVTEAPGETVHALSIGLIKDTTFSTKPWQEAVLTLGRAVTKVRGDAPSPLNVNVVYQVGGTMIDAEFSGVRTGSFRRKDSLLMVQVGIPLTEANADVDEAETIVRERLLAAIAEAEAWARKRRLADDLGQLRVIADAAIAASAG